MHDDEPGDDRDGAGVLLLVGEEVLTTLLGETLEADGHRCDRAPSTLEARRRVLESRYDAILLDLDSLAGGALEVVQLVSRLSPATICILRSRTVTVETVLSAMRAGIGDVLGGTLPVPQVRRRIRAAVRRSRELRQRLDRMVRLGLNARMLAADGASAPAELPSFESLPDRSEDAAPDRAEDAAPERSDDAAPDRAEDAAPAPSARTASFEDAASQQLDPEGLITAAIEHLVDELGPVNVAVYLGTGNARFGLAAYARADLPRASIETALARWSGSVCIAAALDGRPCVHADAARIDEAAPGVSDMDAEAVRELSRRGAIVVPCEVARTCDAIFVILHSGDARLCTEAVPALADFGRVFAEQLARIQRVHSRHLPWWPTEND